MKLYFAFFISLCFIRMSAQSIFNADLIRKLSENNREEKMTVLILVKPDTKISSCESHSFKLNYHVGNLYSITSNAKGIKELAKLKNVRRIEYAKHNKLELMLDTAMIKNKILGAKKGLAPLMQSYDGSGVTIGIIDSGTDFNHPDFKDVNGKSRIKYLWDMSKPKAANTPTAFGYGQEWDNKAIDLGKCTHTDLVKYGHGTLTSGIAAGNGLSVNKYEGIAPKADLIVVALDFNKIGFIISDALQYIITKSQLLNQPLVVNASVGNYFGSHDGTDLETQIINGLIANTPGRALIASCGNGGNIPYHLGYTVVKSDTNFTWVTNGQTEFNITEYADTNQMKDVKYSIGVANKNFNDVGATSFKDYSYALNTIKYDTIYNKSKRIGIIESVASINPFGVYELSITIKADSLNYLWSISHTGMGKIDAWNFDFMSKNLPSALVYPKITKYKAPDVNQTMVSGFQCSNEVIAVGNYVNCSQYIDVNNTIQKISETSNDLHPTSSRGPTRDNRIKPDISASGQYIMAASPLTLIQSFLSTAPQVVAQGGFHTKATGTSASSPVVTGLAALFFQKNPTATNQQLKEAIINCAYRDAFTTENLPNNKWGYGKLDGMSAMTCGSSPINIKMIENSTAIQVFPNPLNNQATILFSNNHSKIIKLFDYAGHLVLEEECHSDVYIFDRQQLSSGLYIMLCEESNTIYRLKLIIL